MPKNITSVEWQASDIPSGLAFDTSTGTFSGTPAGVGDYVIPVTVTTNYGTDTKDVSIKIKETVIEEWKQNIDTQISKLSVKKCLDVGDKILFFGDINNVGGFFFYYDPNTKNCSDVYHLKNGEVYDGTSLENKNDFFKGCAIDPNSKKWIAFFGTHYIRTPAGVKDLGNDFVMYQQMCCWSSSLQKFCSIVDTKGSTYSTNACYSYLFDIDGNLLEKSSDYLYRCNLPLNYIPSELFYWDDSGNKFQAWNSKMPWSSGSGNSFYIYESYDGINWWIRTGKSSYDFGANREIRTVIPIYELSYILLIPFSESFDVDATGVNIYTEFLSSSLESNYWELSGGSNYTLNKAAWSPKKKILCIGSHGTECYFSNSNLEIGKSPFSEKKSIPGKPHKGIKRGGQIIWSDTANAFIAAPDIAGEGFFIYKFND